MSKRAKYILSIFFLAGVGLLAFQNFIDSPTTILNYYNTHLNKCISKDHTLCEGEVIQIQYGLGPKWGLFPDPVPLRPLSGYYVPYEKWGHGISHYDLYAIGVQKRKVIRNTGVYVQDFLERNSYFDPKKLENYTYYYYSTSGSLVTGPLKTTELDYYYNSGIVGSYTPPRRANIFGKIASSKTVGVGEKSTAYNSFGQPISKTDYGIKTDYEYDSQGNLIKEYDWFDNVKTEQADYSDYWCGKPKQVKKPGNITTSKTFFNDCKLESETDALNNKTSYLYDDLGRLSKITPARGAVTTITWPDALTTVVTRNKTKNTETYDVLGRLIKEKSEDIGDASKTTVVKKSYDNDGRLIFESQSNFATPSEFGEKLIYDTLDRLISKERTSDKALTKFSFSAPDRMIETNPLGYKTTTFRKTYGEPDSDLIAKIIKDIKLNPSSTADQLTTEIITDAEGKVKEIIQDGISRKSYYNSNQLLEQQIDPEMAPVVYTYYPGSSLLKTKTVGSSEPVTHKYNINRKPESISDASETQVNSFTYNKNFKILTSTSNAGVRSYDYDENGNKKWEKISIDGYEFRFDFTYTLSDDLETMTYPSILGFSGNASPVRNKATFSPDGFGRSTKITDLSSTLADEVNYHSQGSLKSLKFGNGLVLTATLNGELKIFEEILKNGSQNKIHAKYSYFKDDSVSKIEDLVDSKFTQDIEVDGVGRITSTKWPNGLSLIPAGAANSLGGLISYEANSNLKSVNEFAKNENNLIYDRQTQYLMQTSGAVDRSFTYDQKGQVTSDSAYNYKYNLFDDLTEVSNALNGQLIVKSSYDADNIRIKKQVTNKTTYFVYMNNKLYFEASPEEGTIEYFYIQSHLIASRHVKANVIRYQYYHRDIVDSIVAVSDSAGAITKGAYNTFGSSLVDSALLANKTNLRFTGHYHDDEVGLVYMGARFYDPKIGRFLQVDPVSFSSGNVQSFNRYAYANNNPFVFVDPDGKNPIDRMVYDVSGGAAGGGSGRGSIGTGASPNVQLAPNGWPMISNTLITADKYVMSTKPFVFRADTRPPEIIGKAGQFSAKNPELMYTHTPMEHASGLIRSHVSTTTSQNYAVTWASYQSRANPVYVYQFRNPGNGVDIRATYGKGYDLAYQHEVAFMNINNSFITGYREFTWQNGLFVPTTNLWLPFGW